MKGQPEPAQDTGLGKRVEELEAPSTEWRAVPGKPGYYVNKKGQMRYVPRWNLWTDSWR